MRLQLFSKGFYLYCSRNASGPSAINTGNTHRAALGNIVKHMPGMFWPAEDDCGAEEEGRFSSPEVHVTTVSTQNFSGARHSKWKKELWAVGTAGGLDQQLSWQVQHKLERGGHSMQEMLLGSCSCISEMTFSKGDEQLQFLQSHLFWTPCSGFKHWISPWEDKFYNWTGSYPQYLAGWYL